jgi:dipeptidyl aminopeptidase/acylaminoacyl peptidase
VVPIGQAETFVAAAREAGDTAELQAFDGDHSDVVDTDHEGWQLCVEALERLL